MSNKPALTNLKKVALAILIGVLVAVIYHYFENLVHHSISYVWVTLFDTDVQRIRVVPICLTLTLAYFGIKHLLDPKSENTAVKGVGGFPEISVASLLKILTIGFMSLLAGASLGPEAILVPACILTGAYIGTKLVSRDKQTVSLFGALGFVALFAAFFNSFIVGLLSVALVKKQFKFNLSKSLVLFSIASSASCIYTLRILDGSAYVGIPAHSWSTSLVGVIGLIALLPAGYGMTYLLGSFQRVGELVMKKFKPKTWCMHALIAGSILSVLYLVGGVLAEFTGNESIIPMLQQAPELGLFGLVWLLLVKLVAISWSKASGYTGGMIFPTVFAASVVVAIFQALISDINFTYGLVAVLVGALAADKKVGVLL